METVTIVVNAATLPLALIAITVVLGQCWIKAVRRPRPGRYEVDVQGSGIGDE